MSLAKPPVVVPVEHFTCGCTMAAETRVVIFVPDTCTTHVAGRAIPDDPAFAEWLDLGDPVG